MGERQTVTRVITSDPRETINMTPNVRGDILSPMDATTITSLPMCARNVGRKARRPQHAGCAAAASSSGRGVPCRSACPQQRRENPKKQAELACDIATFTHGKPPKQKWLRSARRWGTCALPAEVLASLRGTLAGQDYTLVLHPVPGDVSQMMVLVLDGHGEDGEVYAVHAAEHLARQFERLWDRVRSYCHSDNGAALTPLCCDIFFRTEQYLRGELSSDYTGGTTATVTLIVDGTFVVSANVGDTPAVLGFDGNRPHQVLTSSHSADSPEEYARYRARCSRDNVTPAEFVYNRFNCPGGHRLPGADGSFEPIPIFTLDENGGATVIGQNSEYMGTLGHHGGIQTVRKHVIRDAGGKAIGTELDKAYLNWGSTVAGRPQNTRMLGDFEDKAALHLDAEPSVSVSRIDRTAGTTWLVVASDGVADAHWFETMMSDIAARSNNGAASAQALCEGLVIDTLKNAKQAKFAFKDELPAWDDLSLTLVALPAIASASSPCIQSVCDQKCAMECEMDCEDEVMAAGGPIRKKQRSMPFVGGVCCV